MTGATCLGAKRVKDDAAAGGGRGGSEEDDMPRGGGYDMMKMFNGWWFVGYSVVLGCRIRRCVWCGGNVGRSGFLEACRGEDAQQLQS